MNTSFMRRNRWRLMRWGVFALALAGLAWTLHAWLPPRPRWVVRGPIDPLGLAPDGKTFRTQAPGKGNDSIWMDNGPQGVVRIWATTYAHRGPVQFWDVDSGREARRLFDGVSTLDNFTFSNDGRQVAALVRHAGPAAMTELHLVDLDTGRESHALIVPRALAWTIAFSAGGELLLMESSRWVAGLEIGNRGPVQSLLLFDTKSLRLLTHMTGEQWQWRWGPDGNTLLLYSHDTTGPATLRRVTRQGEKSAAFHGAGGWIGITPDGKTLLTHAPQIGEVLESTVMLWDTATGKQLGEIPRWDPGHPGELGNSFVLNGRDLVTVQKGSAGELRVVVLDMATQVPLGSVPLKNQWLIVFDEGNVFALSQRTQPQKLTMFRRQPLVQLWERDLSHSELRRVDRLGGTNRLSIGTGADGKQRLQLLDVETGEVCLDAPVRDQHRLMPRGRFLAVDETTTPQADRGLVRELLDRWIALLLRTPANGAEFETTTRVFDTESGAELCRLDVRGARLTDLSADGQSLFLFADDRDGTGATLSCYDVPARRYWAWIIGVPLAIGGLLPALRAGWCRLRRGPVAKVPAG